MNNAIESTFGEQRFKKRMETVAIRRSREKRVVVADELERQTGRTREWFYKKQINGWTTFPLACEEFNRLPMLGDGVYVFKHVSGPLYVGKDSALPSRPRSHINKLGNIYLTMFFALYGIEDVTLSIAVTDKATELETKMITELQPICNTAGTYTKSRFQTKIDDLLKPAGLKTWGITAF